MTTVQKIIPPISTLDKRINNLPCTEMGCNSVFKSKSNLNMHLIRHHKKETLQSIDKGIKIEYHCPADTCPYNINRDQYFTKFKLLKQHYLKVHCTKDIVCSKCHKAFSTAINIKDHEKFCGVDFYCLSCSNKYSTYEALRTHTKRKSHGFKEKLAYLDKNKAHQLAENTTVFFSSRGRLILPKPELKLINEIGIQTDFNCCKFNKKRISPRKRSISSQTNACNVKNLKTMETQTPGDHILKRAMEQADIAPSTAKKMPNQDMYTQTGARTGTAEKATGPFIENSLFSTSNASYLEETPRNPAYSLNVDVDLEDLWNDSGTQTSPIESSMMFMNSTSQAAGNNYLASNCFMGNYEADQLIGNNENKFCNIETQTEVNSIFGENTIYQLPFSNMCTQTANPTLLDLELNDIETQTAWPLYRDDYLVSTETQTSSFVAEFNNSETQTDMGLASATLEVS